MLQPYEPHIYGTNAQEIGWSRCFQFCHSGLSFFSFALVVVSFSLLLFCFFYLTFCFSRLQCMCECVCLCSTLADVTALNIICIAQTIRQTNRIKAFRPCMKNTSKNYGKKQSSVMVLLLCRGIKRKSFRWQTFTHKLCKYYSCQQHKHHVELAQQTNGSKKKKKKTTKHSKNRYGLISEHVDFLRWWCFTVLISTGVGCLATFGSKVCTYSSFFFWLFSTCRNFEIAFTLSYNTFHICLIRLSFYWHLKIMYQNLVVVFSFLVHQIPSISITYTNGFHSK